MEFINQLITGGPILYSFPLNHLNPCFELRELGQQSWRCVMFHEYIDPECIQKTWYLTHLETILCYNNFDHFSMAIYYSERWGQL
jgi:hypothetical protein